MSMISLEPIKPMIAIISEVKNSISFDSHMGPLLMIVLSDRGCCHCDYSLEK